MTFKDLHRSVVQDGGTGAGRALGLIDKHLAKDPTDRLARMYKGSLLTIVAEREFKREKNAIYVETGLKLMASVLNETGPKASIRLEIEYIHATTIATLQIGEECRTKVADHLISLVMRPDFDQLGTFEQVRSLALAASHLKQNDQDRLAASLFQRATALDRDLATDVYSNWLDRMSS